MTLPLLIERPSCLDGVPSWLEDFLSRCPTSPNGVHQWLCSAAHRTHPYLEEEDQIRVLRWAMRACGRAAGRNEVEVTVRNVRGRREHGWVQQTSSWPDVAYSEIDRIVRGGLKHSELRKCNFDRTPTRSWLRKLFPDNPMLCLAEGIPAEMYSEFPAVAWHTRRRDTWCSHRYRLSFFSFIVPNPAKYTWGWTKGEDRRRSTRCDAMFPTRRYLIVEWDFAILSRDGTKETKWAPWLKAWEKAGHSIQDASSALIWHLTEYAPLTLVVFSGGKSLQSWFNVAGQPERLVYDFFSYAVGLGADPMTWTRCQLVRTPASTRSNGKKQRVDYFNPLNVPKP